jgi:hypothetical protein
MQLKILLVQLYSNGDCLFATTIARQIKHDYKNCHLTWAVSPFCKSILENNPFIDEILVVNSVDKDNVSQFRTFKKYINSLVKVGVYDKFFITQHMDTNLAYYDGSIRSSIFNAYQSPITVPIQPILKLYPFELERVNAFLERYNLESYNNIILFEFAPQSGQIIFTKETAILIAEKITRQKDTAIILSSAHKISHPNIAIIDGSELSIRETAGLSNYCTLLLGCSSGITWVTTSSAGKALPMVQLIDPNVKWANPISRDFKRFNISTEQVIELVNYTPSDIANCVVNALTDFYDAKNKYNQEIELNFITTRYIIYNLLCYFEFSAISEHIRINFKKNGFKREFIIEIMIGIVLSPFFLLKNIFLKQINQK